MKNTYYLLKSFAFIILGSIVLSSCEKDDPIIPNEEELITTLTYTLTPDGGGDAVVFYFQDLDGDGGNNPIITSGALISNTVYSGVLQLLNETESPAGDITSEVEKEGAHHQFFFDARGNAQVTYQDKDENGNPLGLITLITTGENATGTLDIVLRHQPLKPNDGSLLDAGGQTDIQVTFDLVIQ